MINKKRVVNQFFFESMVILLPLSIVYILVGTWLSSITDFGRTYVFSSDVTNLREVYGTEVKHGWIEFVPLVKVLKITVLMFPMFFGAD
ncbi:hypothetical protein [Bacillus pumilus]|uniref:hypothetical protein n=1 Tax=Bacillus pumilus TaxID=1408 RepID=UPI00249326B6|nr:hypothetical protein [Bacillus pumilus]